MAAVATTAAAVVAAAAAAVGGDGGSSGGVGGSSGTGGGGQISMVAVALISAHLPVDTRFVLLKEKVQLMSPAQLFPLQFLKFWYVLGRAT